VRALIWIAGALLISHSTSAAASPPPGEQLPEPASLSFGDVTSGSLKHGKRLTASKALRILPRQRWRGYRYGTDELVALLEHAASTLHEATGTRLGVGNLSRKGGGNIRQSVSHNSGRDADIAFAYRDARGKPVDPGRLLPVRRDGSTWRRGVSFDEKRTWIIVKALLTFDGAQIQYLFVSRSIENRLLRHAKRIGEPWLLRYRARAILTQPGGRAGPHNDHLHLRLYCSRDDVLAGCENTGRRHPWARTFWRARAIYEWSLRRRRGASTVRRPPATRSGRAPRTSRTPPTSLRPGAHCLRGRQ
jgi:penicillin-insensitive murein endopeptidase